MLKKADRVYMFPRYGNPYDNYIGVPVKYSKKEAVELAEKYVRERNLKNKEIIVKFRKKKPVKTKDDFLSVINSSIGYQDYLCWAIPVEVIESQAEYEMLIENRLRDVLTKEKTKKLHGIRKRLSEKRKIEDIRKAIAQLIEKHEEEKTGKKTYVDPKKLVIIE